MNDKQKIAGFISYHNIIRPINYPLIGLPFISASIFMFFVVIYFLSSNTNPMERTMCLFVIFFSVFGFFFGLYIRKKYLKMHETEKGKSLYYVQMWAYICGAIEMFIILLYLLALAFDRREAILVAVLTLIIMAVTVIATPIVTRIRIGKGIYLSKENISKKTIAFFTSGAGMTFYIMASQVIRRYSGLMGLLALGYVGIEAGIICGIIYYLKVRYAIKYELEEYLPERPNPSTYTGWQ